jgi:N-acetylneuraminic acid mutarotase
MSWLAKKTKNSPPSERRRHSAFEYEGEMYIYGGDLRPLNSEDSIHHFSQNIYRYNVKESIWTEVIQQKLKPDGRFAHSSVIYQNSMYVFAGIICGLFLNNLLYEFNLKTKEWRNVDYKNSTTLPLFMFAHTSVVHEDKMICYGGESISYLILNSILEYDFKMNKFRDVRTTGDVPECGRFAHTAVVHQGVMYFLIR